MDFNSKVYAMAREDALELGEKLADLNARAQLIQDRADSEGRALTAAEQGQIDRIFSEFKTVQRRQELAKQSEGLGRSMGRIAAPSDPHNSVGAFPQGAGSGSRVPVAGLPQGFAHWGQFFQAVRDSSRLGGTMDQRLRGVYNGPSQSSNENSGAEGGYIVAPEWGPEIMRLIAGEDSLIGMMNVTPISGNTYVQATDQRAPWDNTGGVRAFWGAEGAQYQQSAVDLKAVTKRLCKLTALVPCTEEILEDAPSLDSYLKEKVGTIFDFQIKLALIQGSGSDSPLGILNSPALVTVPKLAGQAASTIVFQNVLDMWAQLLPGSEGRAFWLATKRAQEQLMKMYIPIPNSAGTDTVSGLPCYIPMGSGIQGKPYDRLMGRPIMYSEACSGLGSPGDLILVDGQQYGVILKTAGLVTQFSIHLFFDYGVSCYRFHMRLDGSPFLSAPVLSRDGTTYYSPFVALAQRS
jgi:HK97 family phage major capsid protein